MFIMLYLFCFAENFNICLANQADSEQLLRTMQLIYEFCQSAVFEFVAIL